MSFYSGYPTSGNLQKAIDMHDYAGTLGHKANNNFAPYTNAALGVTDHPTFGKIKMIWAIKDISKGEEIFYDYGYNPYDIETKKFVPWYVEQFNLRTIIKYVAKLS